MMTLMNALLETYDFALKNNLVDNSNLSVDGQLLLPVFHSSRRNKGDNIFEMTINSSSNVISGRFLDEDEICVFPITEDSITRSGSKIAPHAISDELSYLSRKIDFDKNKAYIAVVKEMLDYEKNHRCENFKIIGEYIVKNTVLEDFLRIYLGKKEYQIDNKFNLKFNITQDNGKIKEKSINLEKIFITFKLEKELSGDISLTRDTNLHNFYIKYVRNKNKESKNLEYCDLTGEMDYCVERHRGVIGNAKLISISNNDETYYGRFKNGKDVYSLSYEVSQKVHNMLKYLLENKNYNRFIGENAYVVNWLSNDLSKGGIELVSDLEDEDDFEDVEEVTMSKLGGKISQKLGEYFLGEDGKFTSKSDFYILIIEKISNGRVSIKYFRNLSRSEAYERVMNWYESTRWKFYDIERTPSIYQIVNFVYGQEKEDRNNKVYLSCENKKLSRSTIERLIPCIIDSQKIPKDITRTAFYKLSNKQSYKKKWDAALNIGCSLIKKYKNDYENIKIDPNKISEVKELEESRSFYYGKLMAIYEKIELDAIRGRTGEDSGKGKSQRITNSDRLWNSMIRTPERTRFILESKIKPYMNVLKKNSPGIYVNHDKLITNITLKIISLNESELINKGSLNEDFILGYYYQKNEFYKRKDIESEKSNSKNDNEED